MKAEDLFHLGIVTDDLARTRDELSALFGYEWGPEVGGPIAVTLADGEATVDVRCTFSITEPRLEVVRSVPGTFWEPAADSRIHHVGYWSDDVAGDSAQLVDRGYVAEATRLGPDGVPFFTFHASPAGPRIELVTRAARSGMAQCWAHPA